MVLDNTIFPAAADIPAKYEAGTLNAEGIIGTGAAINYLLEKDINLLFKILIEFKKT
ncbi:MAG: aminotransferase class V-fold PLP-dependent enzyme [Chlorobiaceae bacterium]|nr:aminotransferase class V-fold PLP-dependent enzyme [Chlorobiaceae bacterium]